MGAWWIAALFPLIGLVGLYILLRPVQRTQAHNVATKPSDLSGHWSEATSPGPNKIDPPAS